MPEEDTNVATDQKRKNKKKAVDAIIEENGQNTEVTILYDDGSTEKFIE